MYRLLIVDDEPIIVDGLNAYFTKRNLPDVEIVLAYSASDALSWVNTMKIDVVLIDMCMPEMSGMELLGHIVKQWPRCKAVFLTGHDEFEYVQQAIRQDAVLDYILKTEGMDKIGPAVDKALKLIKEELSVFHHKEWLQQELPKAVSQLQRQLILDVLRRTDAMSYRGLQSEFDALLLPFQVCEPVRVLWLCVENWGKFEKASEKDLMLFAVSNIVEELLGARTAVRCVQYDRQSLICLIQWCKHSSFPPERKEERTAGFIQGTLETIQQVGSDLLQLPMSVAVSGEWLPFEDVAQEAQRLRLAVWSGRSKGMERLTIVHSSHGEAQRSAELSKRMSAQLAMEKLQQSLLQGESWEWTEHYQKLIGLYPESGPEDPFERMMVYQSLCQHILLCLEELGLKDQAVAQAELLRMLQLSSQMCWKEIVLYFQELLEWMQRVSKDHMKREESSLIGKIHYYIQSNLHADLSLSRIAREVSLNPSYLSRWYKQACGKGLSDYIQEARAERSKELLRSTTHKIHEVSEMLGFADPHYFFRFFKKAVGCTPQEYRSQTAGLPNK